MRIETDARCVVLVSKIKQDIEDLHGRSASRKNQKTTKYYPVLLVAGEGKAQMKKVLIDITKGVINEDPPITELPPEEEDMDLLSALAATKGFE